MPLNTLSRGNRRFQLNDSAVNPSNAVQDWITRIEANGGRIPSVNTQRTMEVLYNDLAGAGLVSKMKSLCVFVPDNLTAALTPFIKSAGNNLWRSVGFAPSDLSGSGIVGNAVKYLDTGVIPTVDFPTSTSFGMSLYCTNTLSEGKFDNGSIVNASQQMIWYINNSGGQFFDCWQSSGGGRATYSPGTATAFFSGNRTSATNLSLYKASSVTPFAETANNNTAGIGTMPSYSLWIFAANANGTPNGGLISGKSYSFAAIHEGLVSAEAQNLFNAVQKCRVSLGGGYA
jgi:hypothetical protein